MSIKERRNKINQIASDKRTRVIFKRDRAKSIWVCHSIRDDERHQVVVEWGKAEKWQGIRFFNVSLQCSKNSEANKDGKGHCQGNNHALCYHSLGCLTKAALVNENSLVIFDDFRSAINYNNFGGWLVKISNGNGKEAWGVIR